jgi:hypothetical protein
LPWHDHNIHQNIREEFGANVVFFSMRYFGFAGWLIPITLFIISHMFFAPKIKPLNKGRIGVLIVMFVGATELLEYVQAYCIPPETFLKYSDSRLIANQ